MKIQDITSFLENIAPGYLQESYDNAGLITGDPEWECTGIITSLDATGAVVAEAIEKKCNLIVAHHPIVFSGLKKITGRNYVEKTVITAIKNDIAIYAIHTNLDNLIQGVNGRMADVLGLTNRQILQQKKNLIKKLCVFVPEEHAEKVRQTIFDQGAGQIGNYSECSFNVIGEGTFKAEIGTTPFIGEIGERHLQKEVKVELVFPQWLESRVIKAMIEAHPYEEVAYDIFNLENQVSSMGSGITGDLAETMSELEFLQKIKRSFKLETIRHTGLTGKKVRKVALCGGAGSFLIKTAIGSGVDFYITSDVKYHEFFDAEGKLVIADIGHYESEQYTIDLLFDILKEKFTNFAVQKTGVKTNPVHYFL